MISDEGVEKVETLLPHDRRITIRELASQIPEISACSIDRILSEKLHYHKVCARWVLRMLTDVNKQQRVDCARQFLQQCGTDREEFFGLHSHRGRNVGNSFHY